MLTCYFSFLFIKCLFSCFVDRSVWCLFCRNILNFELFCCLMLQVFQQHFFYKIANENIKNVAASFLKNNQPLHLQIQQRRTYYIYQYLPGRHERYFLLQFFGNFPYQSTILTLQSRDNIVPFTGVHIADIFYKSITLVSKFLLMDQVRNIQVRVRIFAYPVPIRGHPVHIKI